MLSIADINRYSVNRLKALTEAEYLCITHGLGDYWERFLRENTGAGLSYHNRFHAAWMISKVTTMSRIYSLDILSQKYLMLAAMFHDFKHSGGVDTDAENVGRAMAMFRNAAHYHGFENLHRDSPAMEEIIQSVTGLIGVTVYPFEREPTTVSEMIIRDADVMQGMTEDFKKIIYVDLFNEILVKMPELTFHQYRLGQEKFLTDVVMYTDLGKETKQNFLDFQARPFWKEIDEWHRAQVEPIHYWDTIR
jgi:hypothetical protein